jgi:nitrate reductase gamma subunit
LVGTHWPLFAMAAAATGALALVVAFVWKVGRWMRAPVPFRIPLTLGQQKGAGCAARDRTGNPHSTSEVLLRVFLDGVLFRPLFRATPTAPMVGRGLSHGMGRSLWFLAAAFHGSLVIIVLRHLRLVLQPVPGFVAALERLDLATEMILPKVHLTTLIFPLALAVLLGRRLVLLRMRYISLAADYFPLLLLLAIATTGIVARHFVRTDVAAVKGVALGLANHAPVLVSAPDTWLVMHVFLVGVLLVYFPLSKLMHMPGVFMSPTLTMANNNRERRHINLRNPQVATMHYADYEATYRERMIEAGLPVENAPKAK